MKRSCRKKDLHGLSVFVCDSMSCSLVAVLNVVFLNVSPLDDSNSSNTDGF